MSTPIDQISTTIPRFTEDNTENFTAPQLAELNRRFAREMARCGADGMDPAEAEAYLKVCADYTAQRVMADYDYEAGE